MKSRADPASNEKVLVAALTLNLSAGTALRDRVQLVRRYGDYHTALTHLKSPIPSPLLDRGVSEYRDSMRRGFTLLDLLSPEYPALLATMEDPPLVLYVWGQLVDADARAIAIVGSRRASAYGVSACHRLAGGLARRGASVGQRTGPGHRCRGPPGCARGRWADDCGTGLWTQSTLSPRA